MTLGLTTLLASGCSRQSTSSQTDTIPETKEQRAAKQPAKGLDGAWKVVSIGGNGKNMPAERFANMTVTFAGRQYTAKKDGKVFEQATVTADPSKQPKTIDLAFTQGETKGQTALGIYEITGDMLRLAVAEPGGARSTEFANRAGLKQDVWELRRE